MYFKLFKFGRFVAVAALELKAGPNGILHCFAGEIAVLSGNVTGVPLNGTTSIPQ